MEQQQKKKPNPFKLGTGDDTQDVEGWDFEKLSTKVDTALANDKERQETRAKREEREAELAKKRARDKAQKQESQAALESFRLGGMGIFDNFCSCFKKK